MYIVYATEKAKKKYEGKMNKKIKKTVCPSCEIRLIKHTNFTDDEIVEEKTK